MTLPRTIEGRERAKFVESPTRANKSAIETLVGNTSIPIKNVSPFGEFDKIQAAYPNSTTEAYTYSLGGNDIGTVTVTYTTTSKRLIDTVVYNVV